MRRRSKAFSCLAGLSSCFARALYSSSVREKAVRLAEREPMAAGVMVGGGEEASLKVGLTRAESSLRMAVLCLRAVLNAVFCSVSFGVLGAIGKFWAYHDCLLSETSYRTVLIRWQRQFPRDDQQGCFRCCEALERCLLGVLRIRLDLWSLASPETSPIPDPLIGQLQLQTLQVGFDLRSKRPMAA